MLAKWKIELVSFLSSLSLVSVGFSAWNLSSSIPVIETVDGTVQTDYVIKTDDYVYFADNGIILPSYVTDGYITADKNGIYGLSDIGKLTLFFTINGEECNKDSSSFKQNGDIYLNINCTITLKTNATAFFSTHSIVSEDIEFKRDVYSDDETKPTSLSYDIISNENGAVALDLTITNYPYTKIPKNEDDTYTNGKITIVLPFKTTDKSGVYDILESDTFIFDTQVHGHQ